MVIKVKSYVRMGMFDAEFRSDNVKVSCEHRFRLQWTIWTILLLLAASAQSKAASDSHFGPAWDEFELTLDQGYRKEGFGPFYYDEKTGTRHTWAIPPIFSLSEDPATESKEIDFVYPVLSYDRYGGQYRFHVFQLLSWAGGETQTETKRERFTLFPVYFQQRSSDTNQNYTAVVPFYGHLKNRLLRDEIFFVMFPFYTETRRRDVITDNYLYPFFHLRHGDKLSGWQFWPFVGHEHKEITTATNGFGDVSTIAGHDKRFILWPFYFNQHAGIGSDNPDWQEGVLPFYTLQRSPNRDSTTIGWPFFSHVNEKEKKYEEWDAPWPLIVFAKGEGKNTTRVFPFFSHARSANLESTWYLWPIYKFNRVDAEPLDRRRTRILFFLYDDLIDKNTETGVYRRRVELWPFFTHRRDYNGNSRLQVLALLEPFLPGSHKVERGYSHVWSLWRDEKNPKEAKRSQSLLWNLYRREVTPDGKKGSLLFGLFQYESGSAGKRTKVFFVPIGRKQPQFANTTEKN